MSPRSRKHRKAQRTLLIIGEGRHDAAFLKHVKQLYAPRHCGLAVTVMNAKGKGARHVVEWTIRQAAYREFDRVAAMLDTDTDWDEMVAKLARDNNIQVLTAVTCLEEMLLRVLGESPTKTAGGLKSQLRKHLMSEPTVRQAYEASFTREKLEEARTRESTIDELLKLLG